MGLGLRLGDDGRPNAYGRISLLLVRHDSFSNAGATARAPIRYGNLRVLEGGFAAAGSNVLKDRISGGGADRLPGRRGGNSSRRVDPGVDQGFERGERLGEAEAYDAGHNHAAPRTPDESPCAAAATGVVKLSENTCGAMAGPRAG